MQFMLQLNVEKNLAFILIFQCNALGMAKNFRATLTTNQRVKQKHDRFLRLAKYSCSESYK